MKKNEIVNPLQSLYDVFAKANVRPYYRGGLPLGSVVQIGLNGQGMPLLKEEEFRSGESVTKFLAFAPCGISTKAFCERGRVFGPNNEDLTQGCNDVPSVIANIVRAWVAQHPTDEVGNTIPFKVVKIDEAERYGRKITLYSYKMQAPAAQPAQAGAPF